MTWNQGLQRYAVCLHQSESGHKHAPLHKITIFPYNSYRVFALRPPSLLLKVVYVGLSNCHWFSELSATGLAHKE